MKTMIGIFKSRGDAETAITELQDLGIAKDDISYLALDRQDEEAVTANADTAAGQAASGAASGALAGGVIGAIAGLVVANGILPGLGTLFVAGPIATALGLTGAAATAAAGTITGAAAGGIIGALSGLGVDEESAKVYEERIKGGDIAIAATVDNVDEGVATDIFNHNGAEEAHTYSR
jgi:hypothetical protein